MAVFDKKPSATLRLKLVRKNSKKFSKKWKNEKKDTFFKLKHSVDENNFRPPFLQKYPYFSLKHTKKNYIFQICIHIWKNCVSPWYTYLRGGGCKGVQKFGHGKVVRKWKMPEIFREPLSANNRKTTEQNF